MILKSPFFFGRALMTITIFALFTGCVNRATYKRLLIDTRESARKNKKQVESLSRENQVLYEAKLSLEKNLSLMNNKVENAQAALEAELQNHADFRASTERKIAELELQLKGLQEKASKRILEISHQKLAVVDSLVKQIDGISARCMTAQGDYERTVQKLKDDLAEKEFERAREIYALTKIKEELFSKLAEKEQTIQKLRAESNRLFDTIADSIRPASTNEAGPKP
jgi:predicted RNase H-like nuclease (RuvC/YqgF family)